MKALGLFLIATYVILIPHNLIALANKFTKKKNKRSYSNLKNDK